MIYYCYKKEGRAYKEEIKKNYEVTRERERVAEWVFPPHLGGVFLLFSTFLILIQSEIFFPPTTDLPEFLSNFGLYEGKPTTFKA